MTLREVIDRHLAPEINGVHVLPFHPSSSDRGFSVVDYAAVDPAFGTWDDVAALAAGRRLMADAVLNHMSAESAWFRSFLAGEPPYDGFFRTVDPEADLQRGRAAAHAAAGDDASTAPTGRSTCGPRSPPTRSTSTTATRRCCWRRSTSCCATARAGATAIRLDAIAFLWKVEGSPSINLPETHDLIELLRSWLDEVDPGLMLVTETNVPHAENVSYLGRPGSPRGAGGLPVRAPAADAAHAGDRRSGARSSTGRRPSTSCRRAHVPQLHVVARRRRPAPVEALLLGRRGAPA